MRDRINDTVEEYDGLGRRFYLAAREGAASMIGMDRRLASVFDILSIIVGGGVFALTNGILSIVGAFLAVASGFNILWRWYT